MTRPYQGCNKNDGTRNAPKKFSGSSLRNSSFASVVPRYSSRRTPKTYSVPPSTRFIYLTVSNFTRFCLITKFALYTIVTHCTILYKVMQREQSSQQHASPSHTSSLKRPSHPRPTSFPFSPGSISISTSAHRYSSSVFSLSRFHPLSPSQKQRN